MKPQIARRLPPDVARVLLLFLGLVASPLGAADCALTVEVVDPRGEPVAGARVSEIGGGGATSSAEGLVCLATFPTSDAGSIVVTAEGWAVESRALGAGKTRVRIQLRPAFGEELVVSATGNARRLKDVPVHLEAIRRDEIVSTAARTLADAVEYTPGLRIENNCGNCNTTQLRMLGLEGPYTQIVVDGQPTVSSLALVYGLEQIPARMLDGIEILKGSGSAIYGASSIAGTVNLIPHQSDHTHVDLDLEVSSFDGAERRSGTVLRALFDWGSEDGRRSASLYGQQDEVPLVDVDGDGFSEVTRRELTAIGGRAHRLALDDSAQLVADLNWTDASRRGGDVERFGRPPHETEVTEAIDSRSVSGSLRWIHAVDSRTDYRLALSRVELERNSYYGADFDPDAYGSSSGATTVFGSQVNHAYERGTLSWGLQADRDVLFDQQSGYGRRTQETHQSWSVFLQEDRKLAKRTSVLWGARVDQPSSLSDPILSPRVAVLFSPRSDLTLRATYGHGFRPPVTFDEDLHIELVGGGTARVIRSDPNLVEESSRSTLVSVEWRPRLGPRTSGTLEVAAFETRLEDLFFNRDDDDPSTPEREILRVNLGGATVRGVEATLSLRFGSRLQFDGGVVSQSARFDEAEPDFGSRDFWRTPELYGSLSARWSMTERLDLFAGVIYTGPMHAPHYAGFVAEDRLEATPEFTTLDFNLAYRWPLGGEREISLVLGGKNLTGEFQEDLDRGADRDPSYVYGPRFPRSLILSTGLRF